MTRRFRTPAFGAALSLGLLAAGPSLAWAQRGDATLSSGSGRGTGTGTGAGLGTGSAQPGTGEMTGAGSIRPGTDPDRGGIMGGPSRGRLGGQGGTLEPNVPTPPGSRLPGSPYGSAGSGRLPTDPGNPFQGLEGQKIAPELLERMDAQLLDDARKVVDPAERSLALSRVARSKMATRSYREAQIALEEAGQAATLQPEGLVRDLRLMAVVTAMNALATEEIRQAGAYRDVLIPLTADELLPPANEDEEEQKKAAEEAEAEHRKAAAERKYWIESAQYVWRLAGDLAARISSANYRSETLHAVAFDQAAGSQDIINTALKLESSRPESTRETARLRGIADRALVWAESQAWKINRPAWRDKALLAIVSSAAASEQYDRGREIGLRIPQPEFRTDALLRVAEGEARHGRPADATRSYEEAAHAVATIALDDPRNVMANLLIDSLIAVGRFDDARASVTLYNDASRNSDREIEALGAVAQAQGQRGFADSARRWIATEAPPRYRAHLYRRVNDGISLAVDSVHSNQARGGDIMFDRSPASGRNP